MYAFTAIMIPMITTAKPITVRMGLIALCAASASAILFWASLIMPSAAIVQTRSSIASATSRIIDPIVFMQNYLFAYV